MAGEELWGLNCLLGRLGDLGTVLDLLSQLPLHPESRGSSSAHLVSVS